MIEGIRIEPNLLLIILFLRVFFAFFSSWKEIPFSRSSNHGTGSRSVLKALLRNGGITIRGLR